MHYYSVYYKTNPPNISPDLQKELEMGMIKDFESGFLFMHPNKLNDAAIRFAVESYLKDNKMTYTELTITKGEEITEKEFKSRTQYS